jgi:hypothetical protein
MTTIHPNAGAIPMRIRRRLLAAAALLLCAACSPMDSDGPEYVRQVGVLTWVGTEARVQVPAAAQAGQPFTVVVTTWGGSCRHQAPAEVSRTGLQADVTVYDLNQVGGVCDRALRDLEHAVELRFTQPGTATVRIHGLGYDDGGGPVPLVLERTVTIR